MTLSLPCRREGCDEPVPQRAGGRPAEYHSDACRAADWRDRKHRHLVLQVGDLVQMSDERPLLAALAALDDSDLQTLRTWLSAPSTDRSDGFSFGPERTERR